MSIDFDLSDDGRHDSSSFWSSKVPSDATHIVLHMRNADDIESLISENNKLRDEIKKMQRDLHASSVAHVRYLDCLDELKELRYFLKENGIPYRFRNI